MVEDNITAAPKASPQPEHLKITSSLREYQPSDYSPSRCNLTKSCRLNC
jgi:hypothetical protein